MPFALEEERAARELIAGRFREDPMLGSVKYGRKVRRSFYEMWRSSSECAEVDLKIHDSRGGLGNDVLATINGSNQKMLPHAANENFVSADMVIAVGTRRGYASR